MPLALARQAAADSARALSLAPAELLVQAARLLARTLADGGTIYLCGNGGSASQAQHLAGELVGRFLMERPGLPAVALTADTAVLTALGNDYGFERVFARQVRALMKPGDLLWALSTSGRSPNILAALTEARQAGGRTLLMCGPVQPEGLEPDLVIPAPAAATPRIQEVHLFCGHTLCQLIEHLLFNSPGEPERD
ncbi:MAG: SIS domain-containing protein [Candidatus Adiutrix sp.]|jgi:D-sedoheptulose 7-phosphate isomerase|nr:SIS domain-containing protein [Candidatus Adiutrix sp.]